MDSEDEDEDDDDDDYGSQADEDDRDENAIEREQRKRGGKDSEDEGEDEEDSEEERKLKKRKRTKVVPQEIVIPGYTDGMQVGQDVAEEDILTSSREAKGKGKEKENEAIELQQAGTSSNEQQPEEELSLADQIWRKLSSENNNANVAFETLALPEDELDNEENGLLSSSSSSTTNVNAPKPKKQMTLEELWNQYAPPVIVVEEHEDKLPTTKMRRGGGGGGGTNNFDIQEQDELDEDLKKILKEADDAPLYQDEETVMKGLYSGIENFVSKKEAVPPTELTINLLKHQLQGLFWMEAQEGVHKGGILGDEMGLGKTLQCINQPDVKTKIKRSKKKNKFGCWTFGCH